MRDGRRFRYEVYGWGPTTPEDRGILTTASNDLQEMIAYCHRMTDHRHRNRRAEVRDLEQDGRVLYVSERSREGHVGSWFPLDLRGVRLRASGLSERLTTA